MKCLGGNVLDPNWAVGPAKMRIMSSLKCKKLSRRFMSKNVLLPLRMLLKIYALFTHVMDSPELYFYILKLETRLMRH